MGDVIKCPVTVESSGLHWRVVTATGSVLANNLPRFVADEIARKLNAHEAMAAYVLAVDRGNDADELVDDFLDRLRVLRDAAIAAAKGGQS